MLPRLIIAAILVNLSFYICQIAVDLSNIFGFSLKSGLTSVGSVIDQANGYLSASQGGGVWGGLAAGILTASTMTLAFPALVAGLISTLIAVVTISLLLIARKALIIVLVVISPLAFVAFLLPNTEQWFKKWYKMFFGLLLVFPAVGLLFGGGVLAGEIIRTGQDGNTVMEIVGEVVKIIPLFAVWGLLKKSMDVAGSIGAKINQMGGGAGQTLAGKARKRAEQAYIPSLLSQRKQLADRRRTMIRSGAYDKKGGLFDPLRRGASKMFKGLNSNEDLNKLTLGGASNLASYGASMVEDEEKKAVENRMRLIQAQSKDPAKWNDIAQKELTEAVKSGDVVGARAATGVLSQGGSKGVEALHDTLKGMEDNGQLSRDSAVSVGVRRDIMNMGFKGKDNVLNSWAHSDGQKISALENSKNTFEGLTPEELAGQSVKNLDYAIKAGAISPEMARRTLDNSEASGSLNTEKVDRLSSIATPPSGGGITADEMRQVLLDVQKHSGGSASPVQPNNSAPQSSPPQIINPNPKTTNFEGQSYEQRDSGLFTPRRK